MSEDLTRHGSRASPCTCGQVVSSVTYMTTLIGGYETCQTGTAHAHRHDPNRLTYYFLCAACDRGWAQAFGARCDACGWHGAHWDTGVQDEHPDALIMGLLRERKAARDRRGGSYFAGGGT
jgi:hypothetical protein